MDITFTEPSDPTTKLMIMLFNSIFARFILKISTNIKLNICKTTCSREAKSL